MYLAHSLLYIRILPGEVQSPEMLLMLSEGYRARIGELTLSTFPALGVMIASILISDAMVMDYCVLYPAK